jgi:hypothetical protein
MLVIGAILIVLGISFRIAGIGMKINNFFSRVKKEEKKPKKKKK